MARATLTLPSELLDELVPLVNVKTKTEAVIVAIKDEIRRLKLKRIRESAGKLEFDLTADEMRDGKSLVDKLLDDERVCCSGIILAELMQGAKSDREIKVLREFLSVFNFLNETAGTWGAAGALSFSMRKKGKSIPLSDCLIAVLAEENAVQVLTFDRHFDLLATENRARLISRQIP
ncbi:MAG: PIN domain-containing protein [Myxococcota bacterium]